MNAPARLAEAGAVEPVRLQRAEGRARLSFKRRGPATVVDTMFQVGSAKIRIPRTDPGRPAEALLLNTSGGLTDGDLYESRVAWGEATEALVTTQAAERVYRSRGGPARVETHLDVAAGARAAWLPQETILFDRGRLNRRTVAEIADGGSLVAGESLVFGRKAMGEAVALGAISDNWRIRIGGRLVFADGFALDGPVSAELARPTVAGGGSALATLLAIGEGIEALVEPFRAALEGEGVSGGASLVGRVLVARLVAKDGAALKGAMETLIGIAMGVLPGRAEFVAPRSWRC